ncbi:hypothetical protein CVT24_012543 [Panaeolus cyanescens]|uniref:Glucosamine 6-phosphate N-acetyltransferase n=1 Tax=Panaeolus cyanescens TaxID=181874 RepID=A0A409W613_9AGAR|nr:hypothetical protein CVT24_012543 [Panaeolus cyanescens]
MIHVLIALSLGFLPLFFVSHKLGFPWFSSIKNPPTPTISTHELSIPTPDTVDLEDLNIEETMAFTPDAQLDLLFDPKIIPADVKAKLGDDLHLRPLARTDLQRNHLAVLSVLTSTPNLTPAQYSQAFDTLRSCPNTYYTVVIVAKATDSIVGVGSIFMEQKFTRNLGRVGHIEDIAVDKNVQGRKLGLRVIEALTGISESMGCYKTILNCSDHNIPFYEKCGFEKKENEMARYHNIAAVVTAPPPPVVEVERVVAPRL